MSFDYLHSKCTTDKLETFNSYDNKPHDGRPGRQGKLLHILYAACTLASTCSTMHANCGSLLCTQVPVRPGNFIGSAV